MGIDKNVSMQLPELILQDPNLLNLPISQEDLTQ